MEGEEGGGGGRRGEIDGRERGERYVGKGEERERWVEGDGGVGVGER